MRRKRFGRRKFVGGVGAGAAAAMGLPLIGSERLQAAGEFPCRFVVMFTPNGTVREEWTPDGGETDFRMRRILAPLEPHRQDLLILDGIDITILPNAPGDGHQQGMGQILTANELLPGDNKGGCGSCPPVSFASSLSIDQRIANHIMASPGAPVRRSFEFGVDAPDYEDVWTRMVYRGPSAPLPPESDPSRAFQALFASLNPDPDPSGELTRQNWRHRQVADFLNRDFGRMRDRLGGEDRLRIERHIEGIDDIARRLDDPGSVGAVCTIPSDGGGIDFRATNNYPMVGQLQMDMLVSALACDVTRVASLQWDRAVGGQTFPWIGINNGHHSLSHEDEVPNSRELITQINTWYAEQLAYLISKMKEIPEGEGTLLDNTCIVWVNELGDGATHTRRDIPFVVAGSAGGHFRTGRLLRFDSQPHNDLWVSMSQAFGIDTDTFGNPSYCNGPLSGLT